MIGRELLGLSMTLTRLESNGSTMIAFKKSDQDNCFLAFTGIGTFSGTGPRSEISPSKLYDLIRRYAGAFPPLTKHERAYRRYRRRFSDTLHGFRISLEQDPQMYDSHRRFPIR